MNRLLIYFFYDKEGIVDDYVPYFLNAMRPFCSQMCVVVNGILTSESAEKIKKYTDNLILRKNIGFDSAAYKHVIESYGYDKLKEYDELICCNFTFFGPFFPLSELFEKMENRSDLDFWGINRYPECDSKIANVPICEHIQSHFIAFRQSILKSETFKNYWDTLQIPTNYCEAVAFHELRCTPYFKEKGYRFDAFLNQSKYLERNVNSSVSKAFEQIRIDQSPILKRKALLFKNGCIRFPQTSDDTFYDFFSFVQKNSTFPLRYIFQNIKRTTTKDDEIISFKITIKIFF